jgi:predicted DsbA family dithiol-disulfide isomerase
MWRIASGNEPSAQARGVGWHNPSWRANHKRHNGFIIIERGGLIMSKLEVFFDYGCPHCLRGHEYLTELLPRFPDLEIEWRPCEAHPRPEQHGRHSDLCARGMYIARELGSDLMEYHQRMYHAALTNQADIEDIRVIAEVTDGLLDGDKLRAALSGGKYERELLENNRLVWDEYECPAVPSYRMEGNLLKSQLGVGVSKGQLEDFIERHYKSK